MNINNYPDNRNPLTMPLVPTTYRGTHFSHGGIGGYVEVPTIEDLYNIPSEDGPSAPINPDGVSSGRRKLGMIVYVIEDKKYYQLRPKFKDSKKEIPWEVLTAIGDGFRGLLMNPLISYGYCEDPTLNWSSLSEEFNNKNIPIENFNSLKKYGFYADISDESSLQDGYVVGTGNATDGVFHFGNLPEKEDPWIEIFVKDGFDTLNDLNIFASGNAAAYPGQICSVIDTNKIYLIASGVAGLSAQEINTGGGTGGAELFTENITLSLSNGKTFGKYSNGDTIIASGKSANQVIKEACFEALEPTVTLTTSSTIPFGETNPSISLNFAYTINSFGAQVSSAQLETKRENESTWSVVSGFDKNTISPYTHTFSQTQYNTQRVNYRITVTDTAEGTKTVLLNVTPTAYVAPALSNVNVGSTTRYKGDTSGLSYSATLTRSSPKINISSCQLERSTDGGVTWNNVGNSISIDDSSTNPTAKNIGPIVETVGNTSSSAFKNASTIRYRLKVTDSYNTQTLATTTISFFHKCGIIYSSETSIDAQFVHDLPIGTNNNVSTNTYSNFTLQDSKARTIQNITPGNGRYLYYVFASTADALTKINRGFPPVLYDERGAFKDLGTTIYNYTDPSLTSVSYRIARSNSSNAFDNAQIDFG